MKTNQVSVNVNTLTSIGLAVLAVLFVFGVLTGKRIPMINDDRTALLILFVIGFAMCGMGVSRISATGQWTHPLTIIGYILGALTMLTAAAGYFGYRLAFIQNPREAMIAVSALMVTKFVLSIIHRLM